ncbi:MAG: hypothetical protein WCC94_02925 [Candidatus Bathyarchaeia archaeon]
MEKRKGIALLMLGVLLGSLGATVVWNNVCPNRLCRYVIHQPMNLALLGANEHYPAWIRVTGYAPLESPIWKEVSGKLTDTGWWESLDHTWSWDGRYGIVDGEIYATDYYISIQAPDHCTKYIMWSLPTNGTEIVVTLEWGCLPI